MKKLYRSRSNRMLGGVLGGLAEYSGIDASLLRVLFALAFILGVGTLGLVYIIWIFVVPNREDVI
ncbi:PspC domain-containing protein [Cytobacillus suaedae]|uniref:PspC domain-containing protein n=1 Tax=Litchfieldia luteola TaxID=682179 RepID=A0ABR9QEU5_9BACI|nr:PspC domain-containing protein [Cytobacillus luteolus]MBE4907010.1 PspC domain-containing protein [Cytobacillus luteolus]MBP1943523.1 phage shock protein PspC (stress-responsive transcriptional regulator) [Cytobacillus luteolus]QOR66209.1 PspC domain-containing protein [Cytobacillus suaedae]